jgi:hypothetical protein
MADGDEKIDHNDRVLLLNRMTDRPWKGLYNGIRIKWGPREVRSICRAESQHYIDQSRVVACPMNTYYPVQRLVIVEADGKTPSDPAASASPLTEAQCVEYRKHGAIDPTNLPPDREIGGMQLKDPETGEHPTGVVAKPLPKGGVPPASGLAPRRDRAATDAALDDVPY